jgi:small-conductance mechanosensitive channel
LFEIGALFVLPSEINLYSLMTKIILAQSSGGQETPQPAPVAQTAQPAAPAEAPPQAPAAAQAPPADAPPPPPPASVSEAVDETVEAAKTWMDQALDFISNNVLTQAVAIEVSVVIASGILAWTLSVPGTQLLARLWPAKETRRLRSQRLVLETLIVPFFWVVFLWFATSIMRQSDLENVIVRAAASLLNAWVLIRLFSTLVPDAFWSRTFATIAWVIAALNILRLLDPTIAFLDSVAIQAGELRISIYLIIKGLIFIGLMVWIANLLSRTINSRIGKASALTPSVQTLISQTVRLLLLFGAITIGLNAIGVNLTALAVFSGAIGVGIGFGLQSVFSNLVAGIILLFERSIKVGDFIELSEGIQGTVKEITIRSTLVTTNDNIDVLVPNSEFITKQLTNWTLRDALRRFRVPFGVAYGTDKELVRQAGLEAADAVSHTLKGVKGREPEVWLVGFGDSSLDFELVVWLQPDSVMRPAAVNAAYCWALETALGKYGIEIPFPQRDLHIRSGKLPIAIERGKLG